MTGQRPASPPALRTRRSRFGALLAAVIFGLLGLLGLYRPLDALTTDLWTRLTPAHAESEVLIVAIDEASLRRNGRIGTWDRRLYAQAVDRLLEAGARGIGLDVLFPDSSPNDAEAARSLQDRRVVLADAAQFGERVPRNPAFSGAQYGLVLVPSSREGSARRFQTAFALERDARGAPLLEPTLAARLLGLAPAALNTSAHLIRYAGPPGTPFVQISFADVLSGDFRYGDVQDRYVLIGVTAVGLDRDQLLTPYLAANAPLSLYGAPLSAPGVEVQANILHTLLHGGFLELPEALALLLAALLVWLSALRPVRPLPTVLLSGLALLLGALLHWLGVHLPIGALLLAAPIGFALHSGLALSEAAERVGEQLARLGEPAPLHHAPLAGRLELLQRVERRLALEREQLDLLIGNVDQPLFLSDPAGRVQVVNPAGNGLLSPGDLFAEVLAPRLGLGQTALDLAELHSSGRLERFSPRGVLSLAAVVQDGTTVAYVGMLTRPDRFAALLSERERGDEALIHDLRTPLTTLLGFLQYLEETLEGTQGEILRLMLLEGQRLSETLNRYARQDAIEGPALYPVWLDYCALVRRVSSTLAPQFEARQLELNLELPARLTLFADEQHLGRILRALLENAVRFSSPGSTVTLRLERVGSEVYLEVRDQGVGIPEEELGRIFSRHYRSSESGSEQDKAGGGMGLWTARALARLHSGEVLVSSKLGRGSTFTVVLPATREEGRSSLLPPLPHAGD